MCELFFLIGLFLVVRLIIRIGRDIREDIRYDPAVDD